MPDLVTHVSLAYFLKRPKAWARYRVFFYIGAILPDILTRPLYILFPPLYMVIYSLHTPFVVAVLCLLFTMFFEIKHRPGIRLNLFLGIGTHFGLDLLQKSVTVSYYWLFPFSFRSFSLGIFWPDESVRLVPFWVILILSTEAYLRWRKFKEVKTV